MAQSQQVPANAGHDHQAGNLAAALLLPLTLIKQRRPNSSERECCNNCSVTRACRFHTFRIADRFVPKGSLWTSSPPSAILAGAPCIRFIEELHHLAVGHLMEIAPRSMLTAVGQRPLRRRMNA